ncbi:MAG: hypothetical protein ACRDJS_02915 [Actinomycetota bacterium]
MRLDDFSELDEQAFSDALTALLEASSPEVQKVARDNPGMYVRPLEGDRILVYVLEGGDHEVHVGTLDAAAVYRTPPPSPN